MFKIIIAGCGKMSKTWFAYAMERNDCQIVGLVDLFRENAEKRAEEFHLHCPIFTDIQEALTKCDANLLFDVTIPESHMNIVISAIAKGLNVMGEKPMATSMQDVLEILYTVDKSKNSYFVMQNRRFLNNVRAFRQLVDAGTIGVPGFLRADFFLGAHFGGFRDLMDSPLILDMAIHTFDQARFIIGADPVSVYCQEFNPLGSWYKGNSSAVCIFEFSNGCIFSYNGSWSAEGFNTSWESDWRLQASLGTAKWNGNDLPQYEIVKSGDKKFINDFELETVPDEWNGRERHLGCLDEMFDALINNRKAETDCTDNVKSMAMVFAAIKSSKEQRKVYLKELYTS